MGSRNPRKIGMGVLNILGYVERGCRKMGVPIFLRHRNDKSIWVPAFLLIFFIMKYSAFRTRLTSLYGSQTSSVILSTRNRVLSARIKGLCLFQLSSVVFA